MGKGGVGRMRESSNETTCSPEIAAKAATPGLRRQAEVRRTVVAVARIGIVDVTERVGIAAVGALDRGYQPLDCLDGKLLLPRPLAGQGIAGTMGQAHRPKRSTARWPAARRPRSGGFPPNIRPRGSTTCGRFVPGSRRVGWRLHRRVRPIAARPRRRPESVCGWPIPEWRSSTHRDRSPSQRLSHARGARPHLRLAASPGEGLQASRAIAAVRNVRAINVAAAVAAAGVFDVGVARESWKSKHRGMHGFHWPCVSEPPTGAAWGVTIRSIQVEIVVRAGQDRQGDDFRQPRSCAWRGFAVRPLVAIAGCFRQAKPFLAGFDRFLPTENAADGPNDLHAGGQAMRRPVGRRCVPLRHGCRPS